MLHLCYSPMNSRKYITISRRFSIRSLLSKICCTYSLIDQKKIDSGTKGAPTEVFCRRVLFFQVLPGLVTLPLYEILDPFAQDVPWKSWQWVVSDIEVDMLGTSAALFAAEAPMLYFILIHILLCSYKVLGSVALSGNSCLVQVDTFSCNFCEMNSTISKETPQPYQECFVECPVHLRPAFALVVAGRGFFYLRCDVPISCWLSASSCTGSSSLWLQRRVVPTLLHCLRFLKRPLWRQRTVCCVGILRQPAATSRNLTGIMWRQRTVSCVSILRQPAVTSCNLTAIHDITYKGTRSHGMFIFGSVGCRTNCPGLQSQLCFFRW